MNMYYVNGTELVKKHEIEDVRAVIAGDVDHLKSICDKSYLRWSPRGNEGPYAFGPYKLSDNWQ
jgi:hypothetical protein